MEFDDPINYGLMQAGGALLTPRARGGGLGAAFSSFGNTVSRERQNQIDADLKRLLILSRRNAMTDRTAKLDGLPSKVKEVVWYTDVATDEQRKMYLHALRQNVIKGKDGRFYTTGPDGMTELPGWQKTLLGLEQGAAATAQGKADVEDQHTMVTGTNPATNRPEMVTQAEQLQRLGVPTRSPVLSPTLQREMPPGLTPQQQQNGMSMPELVNQTRGALRNPFDGSALPPMQPQAPLLPAVAGAPALAAEQTKLQEQEKYQAKLREEYPKAKGSLKALEATLDQATKQLDKVAANKSGADWNTGLISNLPVRMIKGTAAHQQESDLQTARDMLVIETIKNMKALSATGATGFGQLSEKEGARLENAVGNLKLGQRKEDFEKALAEVKRVIADIKRNASATFDREFGQFNPPNDPLGIR